MACDTTGDEEEVEQTWRLAEGVIFCDLSEHVRSRAKDTGTSGNTKKHALVLVTAP